MQHILNSVLHAVLNHLWLISIWLLLWDLRRSPNLKYSGPPEVVESQILGTSVFWELFGDAMCV